MIHQLTLEFYPSAQCKDFTSSIYDNVESVDEHAHFLWINFNDKSRMAMPIGSIAKITMLPFMYGNISGAAWDVLRKKVIEAKLAGNVIGAIREVRTVTGWGLGESKKWVDETIAEYQLHELYKDAPL